MTWGYVAVAGATLVTGALSNRNARQASGDASSATRKAAQTAEGRLKQGYSDAQGRLSPFMATELAANNQLAYEMGLTPDYGNQDLPDVATLEAQLAEIEANAPQQFKEEGFDASTYFQPKNKLIYDSPTNYIFNRSKRKKAKKKARRAKAAYERELSEYNNYIDQTTKLRDQIAMAQQDQPERGRSYLNNPGYQAAIEEGVGAVNQGASNAGSLYSGARGEALKDVGPGAQQSYYNNYMNILQNMASPRSTTNLSNIGIGVAGQINQGNFAATNQSNAYNLGAAADKNAFIADATGALTSAAGAYLNRPQSTQPTQNSHDEALRYAGYI